MTDAIPVTMGRQVNVFMGPSPDEGPFTATVAAVNDEQRFVTAFVFRPIWDTPRRLDRVWEKAAPGEAHQRYPYWEWPKRG